MHGLSATFTTNGCDFAFDELVLFKNLNQIGYIIKKKKTNVPTYIKIMTIKLKTRWEAFLICKNNQPKVLFIFFLSFCMNIMGKPEVLIQ